MKFSLCKPASLCPTLRSRHKKKKKKEDEEEEEEEEERSKSRKKNQQQPKQSGRSKELSTARGGGGGWSGLNTSRSSLRQQFHNGNGTRANRRGTGSRTIYYYNPESLPSSSEAFALFMGVYPRYAETADLDELRAREYRHLGGGRVYLDYCGFGLFSYSQLTLSQSSPFALAAVSASSLRVHALYGVGAGTGAVEQSLRARIADFLGVGEPGNYTVVFTTSRGASFRLLADAYPFAARRALLTMYDYESESVGFMQRCAEEKGAKAANACFQWPSLRLCSADLKRRIASTASSKGSGLFVFPVQSRVSGAKYSYQWMSLAQRNKWHVLLDASALGPKDMASLGLSLFRPDFIVASFYKLFGADPSGFGCLFIKNSAMHVIQDSGSMPTPGIVRVIPLPQYISNESNSNGDEYEEEEEEDEEEKEVEIGANELMDIESSFSGPMLGFNRPAHTLGESRHSLHFSLEDVEEGNENEVEVEEEEEEDDFLSVDKASHSSVFSEDGATDEVYSVCSMSEEVFSPLSCFNHGELHSHPPLVVQSRCQDRCSCSCSCHEDAKQKSPNLPCRRESESDNVSSFSDAYSEISDALCLNLEEIELSENGPWKPQQVATSEIIEVGSEAESSTSMYKGCNNFPCSKDVSGLQGRRSLQEGDSDRERTIQRETEGDFRLFGRRDKMAYPVSIDVGEEDGEEDLFDGGIEAEIGDEGSGGSEREPEIFCRGLDHADVMGLNKSNRRLRCLINWLITSLLQLHHPGPERDLALVQIYGPWTRFDRGASVAFNLFDCHGRMLHPELVQMLADKYDISVSVGYLQSLRFSESRLNGHYLNAIKGKHRSSKPMQRVEVVTVALGLLSDFEDVYKLWAFVGCFLDADFVSREGGIWLQAQPGQEIQG